MENQECKMEELNFQPGNEPQIRKERKILEFFTRFDNDKQKKGKLQFFNKESIEGLLTVFQMNPNRMDFITEQQLLAQINLFMSNGKKMNCLRYEQINVKFNQFYILFQGCLVKKHENPLNNAHALNPQSTKKSRPSSRLKTWTFNEQGMFRGSQALMHVAMNIKKNQYQYKNISSNVQLSPRTIYYDPLDKRPYECRTNCILFQFPKLCLEKFQSWIQNKEKEGLVKFMSVCFGVEDQKGLSKLIQKTVRIKKITKSTIVVQPNTIYMIYAGQVLVKTKYYSIHLTKNSIIYKDDNFDEFLVETKNMQTSLIWIPFSSIVELLQQSFSSLLEGIKNKLHSLHHERLQLLYKVEIYQEQSKEIEPIFNTRILNIKSFEKQRKYEWLNQIEEKNQFHKYCVSTPKTPNTNSARFRIDPFANKQNMIQSDFAVFLSNYPYRKLVESQVRLNQTLKRPISNTNRKFPIVYEAITEEQRKRVQRQKKKIYYMNKVRKLKIRNIVEKQIPNLKKNKYDVEAAQRQMYNNSLFTNIIEYPMNGISQGAKESITKNITKMLKIAESNSKIKTIEKNNLSQTNAKDHENEIDKQSIKAFSLENDSNFDDNFSEKENLTSNYQKVQLKRRSENDNEIQNQLKTVSFLFGNNFSSHLPTQKDIKYRALKTFHNFVDNDKRKDLHLKTSIQKKSHQRKPTQSLEKPPCVILKIQQNPIGQSVKEELRL